MATMNWWDKRTVLEKKCIVTITILLLVFIVLVTLIIVLKEETYCQTPSCLKSSQHILDLADFQQNPCSNFYNYACGNFLNYSQQFKQPIIDNGKNNKLKSLLLEPISPGDPKSLKLQKLFYESCMDLEAIDANNDTTFWDLITKLGGWPVVSGNNWEEDAFDFVEMMVTLRKMGLQYDWFLDISVFSIAGGNTILEINVPDTANKIDDTVKLHYVNLMTEIAKAFGAYSYVALPQMREVLHFENKLARLIEEISDENEKFYKHGPPKMTLKQVQTTWQKINWLELLNQITNKQLSENEEVAFFVQNYLPKLDKLLRLTVKRIQVNYVIWKLIEAYGPMLSYKIRDLMANYKKLSTNEYDLWYRDREDYCFEESRSFFQYALEAAYLRKYVSREKRQNVEEMVERIEVQMEKHLIESKWMDDKTKKAAIRKLQNISFIVGGPEEMYYVEQFDKFIGVKDMMFESLDIIKMHTKLSLKEYDTFYDGIKQHNFPKSILYGLVPLVHVKFYREYNLLYIGAGNLDEIFYDENRPNYLNYGILGTVIAQEMTHGFDTPLFLNRSWWTNETLNNFRTDIECLLKNCNDGLEPKYIEMDCKDNLSENIADYTGINLSYETYEQWVQEYGTEPKLPGINLNNRQSFWLAYSSMLCHMSLVEIDDYKTLPAYRIIGSYRNSYHFSEDFWCPFGSIMNPQKKCQIL